MTLFHTAQTPPSTLGPETIVYEGWLSRLVNILIPLAMTLGAAGGSLTIVYLWLTDLVQPELGGFDIFLGLLFCLIFGLVGYCLLWASLQRSNWLLRIRPQELVLKFRSDMNARLPEPHPVVIVLAYAQMSWARKTREWVRHYSLSSSNGPSQYRAYFLDLKLQLSLQELDQLRQAIDTEIRYKPGAGSPSLFHHYPCTFRWRCAANPMGERAASQVGHDDRHAPAPCPRRAGIRFIGRFGQSGQPH